MTETKRFQRTREDFVCEHCRLEVSGNGYTNHCPRCLWSKHVDINPGDRVSTCGGLMRPVGLEVRGREHTIRHRCERCGFERGNKTSPQDSMDAIIQLSASERG